MPYLVIQTQRFRWWLAALRDRRARAKIARRIDRMTRGNLGDHRAVGNGLFEIRIDEGPGYRLYYVERDGELVILLCGGDKGSQRRDIELARKLAEEV